MVLFKFQKCQIINSSSSEEYLRSSYDCYERIKMIVVLLKGTQYQWNFGQRKTEIIIPFKQYSSVFSSCIIKNGTFESWHFVMMFNNPPYIRFYIDFKFWMKHCLYIENQKNYSVSNVEEWTRLSKTSCLRQSSTKSIVTKMNLLKKVVSSKGMPMNEQAHTSRYTRTEL